MSGKSESPLSHHQQALPQVVVYSLLQAILKHELQALRRKLGYFLSLRIFPIPKTNILLFMNMPLKYKKPLPGRGQGGEEEG